MQKKFHMMQKKIHPLQKRENLELSERVRIGVAKRGKIVGLCFKWFQKSFQEWCKKKFHVMQKKFHVMQKKFQVMKKSNPDWKKEGWVKGNEGNKKIEK